MNMKKTLVASALAVALGGVSAAQANTAGLTGVWQGTYTFTMTSPSGGGVGTPSSSSLDLGFQSEQCQLNVWYDLHYQHRDLLCKRLDCARRDLR